MNARISATTYAGTGYIAAVSSYNYVNGAVVYTSIGKNATVGASVSASMNITNIPLTGGMFAYTTTFIIAQPGTDKGYIKTIGINNDYTTIPEFIGGIPTIGLNTTVIQTITAIISANILTKILTNATVCGPVA